MLDWFFDTVIKRAGDYSGQAAKTLFASRRLGFLTAMACTLAAMGLGFWSLQRSDRYQRLVEAALSKSTENTPQTLKAIEALVLANAASDPFGTQFPFKKAVESAPLSTDLKQTLAKIHEVLRTEGAPAVSGDLQLILPLGTPEAPLRFQDAIVTEARREPDVGFLFLPARLLHLPATTFRSIRPGDQSLAGLLSLVGDKTQPSKARCMPGAPPLCDDILTTSNLLPALYDATRKPVTPQTLTGLDATPQQVYAITENGLNRIVSASQRDSSIYRSQFNASIVFQARPYYVQAFKQSGSEAPPEIDDALRKATTLGSFFYVTEPYLDLGGNGIVVTLARAFRYAGHSDGAICLDLKVSREYQLRAKTQELVADLDGLATVMTCDTRSAGQPVCNRADGSQALYDEIHESVQKEMNEASGELRSSDFGGDIRLLSTGVEPPPPPVNAGMFARFWQLAAHRSSKLRFTIPLEPPAVIDARSDQVRLTLLAVSLNVGAYLQKTATAGAFALFFLGIALSVLVGSWATDARLTEKTREEKQELHAALDNVANVMMYANIPYVRLDVNDHVINGNLALAKFFDLPPTSDSIETKLKRTKFADWLADKNSTIEYSRVQKLRAEGKTVDPYHLTFHTSTNATRRALVVSSVVPASSVTTGGLPETFGVLVIDQ